MINYVEGDLFSAIKEKKDIFIVLPHICNCWSSFGAGFVVPLKKNFPEAETTYYTESMELGHVSYVVKDNVMICNMIAQTLGGKRPLFYNHLAVCLNKVAEQVNVVRSYQPFMPRLLVQI